MTHKVTLVLDHPSGIVNTETARRHCITRTGLFTIINALANLAVVDQPIADLFLRRRQRFRECVRV